MLECKNTGTLQRSLRARNFLRPEHVMINCVKKQVNKYFIANVIFRLEFVLHFQLD